MHLDTFNQIPLEQAQSILSQCVAIPSWLHSLASERPYVSLEALHKRAQEQAATWQWQEVAAALAKHPRIGERIEESSGSSPLSAKEQAFSKQEQGQLQLDNSLEQALYQGNLDYEEKFGHIFLIRAAGRSAHEVLAELSRRLHNDKTREQQEVSQQLAEITLLRLKQEVSA